MSGHKVDVFLVWRDSSNKWTSFLRESFRHLEILMHDDISWYRLMPRMDRLIPEVLGFTPDDNLPKLYASHGMKVLKITIQTEVERNFPSFQILNMVNCVSTAKYCLGIRNWAQTPYGLYKRLLKMKYKKRFKMPIIDVHIIT